MADSARLPPTRYDRAAMRRKAVIGDVVGAVLILLPVIILLAVAGF